MAMRLYDITTGTGDFIANGVVSHNCFARPTHKYLDFNAGRDFEKEIVVKVNVPEVLRVELARPSWKGEHVAMGTNTDPYQWVEGRYKLMRGIWEALRDARQPVLGADEVAAAAARPRPDAGDRRASPTSARTSRSRRSTRRRGGRASRTRRNPRARMEAVAELNRAGHPDGRPGRAADARASTTTRARSRRSCRRPPTRGRRASAASRCTCAARCAASSWSGCGPTGRTSSSATRSSTHAARTCRA